MFMSMQSRESAVLTNDPNVRAVLCSRSVV